MSEPAYWSVESIGKRLDSVLRNQPRNKLLISQLRARLAKAGGIQRPHVQTQVRPAISGTFSKSRPAISPRLADLSEKLRTLWESRPSKTLFDTALRLGLESQAAENLVVDLVSFGIVRYESRNSGFSAVF